MENMTDVSSSLPTEQDVVPHLEPTAAVAAEAVETKVAAVEEDEDDDADDSGDDTEDTNSGILFSSHIYRGSDADVSDKSHQCVLFNVPSLLFDKRWLGADGVVVELLDTSKGVEDVMARTLHNAMEESGLRATVTPLSKKSTSSSSSAAAAAPLAVEEVRERGAVRVSDVTHLKDQIDPRPMTALVRHALWVEPNKIHKRPPGGGDDAAWFVSVCPNPQRFYELLGRELQRCGDDQRYILAALKHTKKDEENEHLKEKGRAAYERHQQASATLTQLQQVQLGEVGFIENCGVCDRIIRVCNRSMRHHAIPTSAGASLESLSSKVLALELKLAAAAGAKNKQKRKRLQRKLKELRTEKSTVQAEQRVQARSRAAAQASVAKAVAQNSNGSSGATVSIPVHSGVGDASTSWIPPVHVPAGAAATSADAPDLD